MILENKSIGRDFTEGVLAWFKAAQTAHKGMKTQVLGLFIQNIRAIQQVFFTLKSKQ